MAGVPTVDPPPPACPLPSLSLTYPCKENTHVQKHLEVFLYFASHTCSPMINTATSEAAKLAKRFFLLSWRRSIATWSRAQIYWQIGRPSSLRDRKTRCFRLPNSDWGIEIQSNLDHQDELQQTGRNSLKICSAPFSWRYPSFRSK